MKLNCVEQGYRNRRLIYDLLKRENKWLNVKFIGKVMKLSDSSIHIHCRNLMRFGLVEESKIKIQTHENCQPRKVIHYRIKPH
jgi:predicted transcriptional regulator